MYAILKPGFVAGMFKLQVNLDVPISTLVRLGDQFKVVSFKDIKTFPCYILERKVGDFSFHQGKPRIKRKKNRTGLPILYTITREFIFIGESGCVDEMGSLDHDHLGEAS